MGSWMKELKEGKGGSDMTDEVGPVLCVNVFVQ